MRVKRVFAASLLCLLVTVPALGQKVPSEAWMGIYLGKMKLGYSRFFLDKAEFEGKPGYRLESSSVIKAPVLGTEIEQKIETITYVNSSYEPVYETFKTSSAGYTQTVKARFSLSEIVADVDADGSKSKKTIPIPAGVKLSAEDSNLLSQKGALKVGDKKTFYSFNPLSLAIDPIQIEVLRSEDIVLDDGRHACLVIKSASPMGDATSWQEEGGELLKVEMNLGFTMIREPKEKASSMQSSSEYQPSADLAVLTSAKSDKKVPEPRKVKSLKVRLIGFTDRNLVMSDARQKATYRDGSPASADYEVKASEFDPTKSLTLPMKTEGMEQFLTKSENINSGDPEIILAARQIVGTEKNAYLAASRIREWVDENLTTSGEVGLLRTSTDILKTKSGVCRDYAVLYTALARAAGIPTKIATGVMYFRDAFYFHAWAESYVGEWVPMDPTLSTDFVDATHIKLVEGDALAMFKAVKAVGTLKAEISDFR